MPKTRPILPDERSVIEFPDAVERKQPWTTLFLDVAQVADSIIPWGKSPARRDTQLREYWPTENMLAGAMYAVCARNAASPWELEGPPEQVKAVKYLLNTAYTSGGQIGWIDFLMAFSQDFYGVDNGAVIEIVRDSPTSPVKGIGQLDSVMCTRTGDPKFPIIYTDRKGREHKMPWYNVIAKAEMPSPIESMNGIGYSAVTRILRTSQILRDLAQYKHEKVSGRFIREIHVVGGVSKGEIKDVIERDQENANNAGLIRFIQPSIIASLDPEKPVSLETIELASLPDNFDFDQEMKWYIATLALGFGVDYQDFAPLPGGNLGTSTQSEILHRKSRGKGPALFMEMIQNMFHWYGVIPKSVTFNFSEADLSAQEDEATIKKMRAETRAIRIASGEITPEMARILAVEDDDLEEEQIVDMEPVEAPIEEKGFLRKVFSK